MISTASADEGAVSATTAATAPATPQISAPTAAQNAMRLVPGVTRASTNARSNFSELIQRRVSTSSRPSMPIVTYPPPKVVLPMRKKISVSFLSDGFSYNRIFVMNLGLTNKIAMVAGASRGLGFAVARALAREGAKVSMSSRNPEAALAASKMIEKEMGADILTLAAD